MAPYLYFSPQLVSLAHHLKTHLETENPARPVLSPSLVVVPTMNLSRWLKLFLSEQSGIFMNVKFLYLEEGLWQMLRALSPDLLSDAELLDSARFRWLLFFILMGREKDPEMPEMLRRYVGGEKTSPDLRAWQLAGTLARLFQEYAYHRADMIERWRKTDAKTGDPVEAAQHWIYRRAMDLNAAMGGISGKKRFTLTDCASQIPEADFFAAPNRSFPPIHFFGLSQISPFHVHLMSRLGVVFDLYVYSVNPSQEYWEDIRTPAEKKWHLRHGAHILAPDAAEWEAGELFSDADHPLLSAWGKTGRESIRLLCQLTHYDFQVKLDDPPPPDTVLGAVRHRLLTLSADDAFSPLPQDRSLQISACPGIRREVESVYQNILYQLEMDPTLSMTDIAVMVSDMSRYKPMVDAVFGQRPSRIRFNLVDARASMESHVARAILALTPIAKGDFSRKAVFDLLENPCVMEKWHYTPDDLGVWIHWAHELGIFHDFENPPAFPEPDIPRAGRYSWKQGLERLRLSRIMTSPADVPAGDPAPHFAGYVPFSDIHTSDDGLLETFCAVVTELFQHAAAFRAHKTASARTWRELFFRMTDALITVPDDVPGETAVYQTVVDAFSVFDDYDLMMTADRGRPLTQDALWIFVRSHLEGMSGGKGAYLVDGVTVSAMMPMRPIPFKIIYVLGLEEGRFPAKHLSSPLDLRNRKRRIGDVTPLDRDRYLFLEILLSARSRLYLSYVCRDLQKDRELSPASVVHQLRRYVETAILGKKAFAVRQIPLRADSVDYFSVDVITPWSDIMARTADIHRLAGLQRCGLGPVFETSASDAEKARSRRYLPDFSLPANLAETAPPYAPTDAAQISVRLLYRFLLDPVAAVSARHLEIEDRQDGALRVAEQSDEPFSTGFPLDYQLRTLPVHRWLSGEASSPAPVCSLEALENRFDALYPDFYRRGQTPGGAFSRQDQDRLKTLVMKTGGQMQPLVNAIKHAKQCFLWVGMGEETGDTLAGSGKRVFLPAAAIDLGSESSSFQPETVLLTGGLPWVWQDPDRTWHSLILSSAQKKRVPDKSVISPVLSLMALGAGKIAVPWEGADRMVLHVVSPDAIQEYPVCLDPVFSADYLGQLIRAFLAPFPLLWLPFDRIFKNSTLKKKIAADAVTDADRELFCRILAEQDPELLATLMVAVIPQDSLDHARWRFRIFLPDAGKDSSGPC
ncbi:exodeoxyribonuclease V subunit gamma [Desulfosarcina sp. OttesenSCG-928-G17]|nr:exodeoxyribonuclease V subunit gamma [Desulfosarcina sp. OttesenSCG-928-G17]